MNLIDAFKDDRYLIPLDLAERMGFTRDRSGTIKLAKAIRRQFDIKTRSGRINGKPVRCYDLVDFKCAAKGVKYEGANTLAMERRKARGAAAQRDFYRGQLKRYARFEKLVGELRVLLPRMESISALMKVESLCVESGRYHSNLSQSRPAKGQRKQALTTAPQSASGHCRRRLRSSPVKCYSRR